MKTIEKHYNSLEEAAEEYRRESYRKSILPNIDGPTNEYGGNIKDAFIAGAEWARKQMSLPEEQSKLRNREAWITRAKRELEDKQ